MKRDKAWLINELLDVEVDGYDSYYNGDYEDGLAYALKLAHQLDEPEVLSQEWIDNNVVHIRGLGDIFEAENVENLLVPKQELPVIPKFVAEYLCRAKADVTLMRVLELANTRNELPKWDKEYDWISANDETFARAWLYGFTVEEEQKFYVLDKEDATLLKKSAAGEGVAKSVGTNIYNVKSWKDEEKYQLTEQEIRDYDERYWAFAVEVAE